MRFHERVLANPAAYCLDAAGEARFRRSMAAAAYEQSRLANKAAGVGKWRTPEERARMKLEQNTALRKADRERYRAHSRAYSSKRRASCVALTPEPASRAQRAALVAPGRVCHYCPSPATQVDHYIPIARWATTALTEAQRANGPDHISNMVGACAACNHSKGPKLPGAEWCGRRGGGRPWSPLK